ncbi:Hypothetical protein FKW44_023434 [Caligus rogercresseyi]|uniref:Uncharacterized protein n=1 Tax=Caligus rogercresseyi TaxID=217165 RepID=A0A7T8GNY8_CALRO|nr:Hypothetical protein FKW44_023434 [Caligus rogercresseyi]
MECGEATGSGVGPLGPLQPPNGERGCHLPIGNTVWKVSNDPPSHSPNCSSVTTKEREGQLSI